MTKSEFLPVLGVGLGVRHDIHDPVIHVIRGKPFHSTFDSDGIIIQPDETIAAFDWSEEFGE